MLSHFVTKTRAGYGYGCRSTLHDSSRLPRPQQPTAKLGIRLCWPGYCFAGSLDSDSVLVLETGRFVDLYRLPALPVPVKPTNIIHHSYPHSTTTPDDTTTTLHVRPTDHIRGGPKKSGDERARTTADSLD